MGMISDGYRFIPTAKEQRANGEMTIADQKVANGIYHHTIAGVLCSTVLPQALIGGANLLFNGSNSPDSDDAKSKSKKQTYNEFMDLKKNYEVAVRENNTDKANKLYGQLNTMFNKNPKNTKLASEWKNIKNSHNNNKFGLS